MIILITGGSGFIGQALIKSLINDGHQLIAISRNLGGAKVVTEGVDWISSIAEVGDRVVEAVINLAGEPIIDKHWSAAQKLKLAQSRQHYTAALVSWLAGLTVRPKVFISGSAIGYYGAHGGDVILDEDAAVEDGFTHQLCSGWERAANAAQLIGCRVCTLRTGVVLAGHGGALKKMLMPFKLGVGGRIGKGNQWFSWIHLADQISAIQLLLEDESLSGAFNLVAPNAVTNAQFSEALGKRLSRPVWLPVPAVVLSFLMGERAELLLKGQRVYPKKLLEAGFAFRHPNVEQALQACDL